MNFENFNTIIFDLGGVIININPGLTFRALLEQGREEHRSCNLEKERIFLDYETGSVDDHSFIDQVKHSFLKPETSKDDIILAWNKMILDIPERRIRKLKELKERFNLILLSNTNRIHMEAVNEELERVTGKQDLSEFFDQVYYSMEIGKRKPDRETFEWVIEQNNLTAEKVLFIDDNEDNIASAARLGIQVLKIREGDEWLEL